MRGNIWDVWDAWDGCFDIPWCVYKSNTKFKPSQYVFVDVGVMSVYPSHPSHPSHLWKKWNYEHTNSKRVVEMTNFTKSKCDTRPTASIVIKFAIEPETNRKCPLCGRRFYMADKTWAYMEGTTDPVCFDCAGPDLAAMIEVLINCLMGKTGIVSSGSLAGTAYTMCQRWRPVGQKRRTVRYTWSSVKIRI